MKEFIGVSNSANIQEALKDALHKAQQAQHPDAHIVWSLKEINGERGTMAGLDILSVKIEAGLVCK